MGEVLDFLKFKRRKLRLKQERLEQEALFRIYGFLELGGGLDFCAYCEQMRGFDGRCKNEKCPASMGPSKEGA